MGRKQIEINNIQDRQGTPWRPTVQGRLKVPASLLSILLFAFTLTGCGFTTGPSNGGGPNPLTISTSSLPSGKSQTSYSATLSATGGKQPYSWSLSSGALPAGLSLTSSTGQISGTPTQSGSFGFTAKVVDSSSPAQSATQSLTLSISSSSSGLQITTSKLPNGQVGNKYQSTLAATGGTSPYIWSTTSGSLPAGLSLSSSSGTISGTPTTTGTSNFTIQVTDSKSQTASASLSITISSSGGGSTSLMITTNSLPGAQVSQPYSVTLAASGGQAPYTWGMASGAGSLPPGLTLAASTGTISGTPTTSNAFTFTVQVSDSSSPQQTDTHTYTMTTLGVTLDQYGGREDINCATITPYFHFEKISGRWYFCDPAGHGFISMSLGGIGTLSNNTLDCNGVNVYPIYAAKYGDVTYNWGWQTLKRMTTWGFNSVGQDSIGFVQPDTTCSNCVWPNGTQPIPLPFITEIKPAESASINVNGFLSEPIKDEMSGTNSNYTGWRGAALFDVFDPKLNIWLQSALASTTNPGIQKIVSNDPYLLGVLTDDSDYFWGSGSGPDFATGHTGANIAWMTLITAPEQTYIQSTPFGHETFLYLTSQVFSKTLATNPTTLCSIANPCSLRDYLWQKYSGNISSLNASWGSNYTTFDSTGIQVTGENIGVGDGSTTVFTHTLAHSPLSPYSVLISVGGVPQAGDCPWFHSGCGATTPSTGSLGSPTAGYITQSSSSINYSTGAISIVFVTPPPVGTSITVTYVYHGWMSGGTGLMDEDGSHTSWVGTNWFCLEGPDPNFPTYFSCVGGGGNNNPVPNANPNLGADLDTWVSQYSAEFFKTMHDDLKAVSKVPYLGLDIMGSWGGPAYSKFLEGAAPYLDGAYVSMDYWWPNPSPAAFQSIYQYTTRYLGDLPFMKFGVITAHSDSSYYCMAGGGPNDMPDQATRGQMWYNTVSYLYSTPGYNGTYPFVGADWWSWQDSQGIDQGVVSLHDNAYDGHEAVTGTVPCSPPLQAFSCGGEAGNYGNVISQILSSNLYWLTH
jgi:hypothetical protein